MAWELFNEVQWVDAVKLHPERIPDVIAWHKEMGDYVRSIDPYHHLVTSSSSETLDPRVFAAMDYLQPHTYPPSIYGAILGTAVPKDRPLFYGEIGPGGRGSSDKMAVRDGFMGGLLAGQAGPGEYWFWDRVYRSNLYAEYANDSKVLARCGFAEHPSAKPAPIEVFGGVPGDLMLRPGRGWAPSAKTSYDLPRDASIGALPLLSGYIQGAGSATRQTMMPGPLRFRFVAKSAGEAHVRISQISKRGAGIRISVNGASLASKDWPATERDTRVREDFAIPFGVGSNEIVIDNPGADWFTLDSIEIPGVGPGVSAASLRTAHYALARLQWSEIGDAAKSISMPGLASGRYELRQFDLETGQEKDSSVTIEGGKLAAYEPFALDEAVALFRR
jgi:hypothetical protein